MIGGARTIKSYGWEWHYTKKIYAARAKQKKILFWIGIIGFLGISVFQNGGIVAVLIIFTRKWYMGQKLDESVSMALLAMCYYIFLAVNALTYFAMTTF